MKRIPGYNWTLVELKYRDTLDKALSISGYNWTLVELKLH